MKTVFRIVPAKMRFERAHRTVAWLVVGAWFIALGMAQAETSILFTASQRQKLVSLVQTNADASKLFQQIQRRADALLNTPPHPIQRIATAGRLAKDAAKIESRVALEDMKKIEAFEF